MSTVKPLSALASLDAFETHAAFISIVTIGKCSSVQILAGYSVALKVGSM